MLLKRFDEEKLAQTSWLLGCSACGEALVVDPNRDVEQYVRAAEREGLRIAHVTETHIHADFVSGTRELAVRTGARVYLSGEGGPDWQYAWAKDAGAVLLRDGDTIRIGRVHVQVVHTPGHTPEHVSFVVTDGATSDQPIGVFTGDFVFVGEVGRPDLLERAAGYQGTMEQGATSLFESLKAFRSFPDHVQVWPGHGAGSACGKSLGAIPQSTVGYEKLTSWAFRTGDRAAFIREVLSGQPDPPRYFARMKRVNRDGPPILGTRAATEVLDPEALPGILEKGGIIVDVRHAQEFGAGHIPGTINIPANRSFTNWAGSLLPPDEPVFLLVGDREMSRVDELVMDLAKIGIDRASGVFVPGALAAWSATRGELEPTLRISPREAATLAERGDIVLLDVREPREWDAGHVAGAVHLPLGRFPEKLAELDPSRPWVTMCQGGSRSAIAASLLQQTGISHAMNLEGGLTAWTHEGLPTAKEASEWATSR